MCVFRLPDFLHPELHKDSDETNRYFKPHTHQLYHISNVCFILNTCISPPETCNALTNARLPFMDIEFGTCLYDCTWFSYDVIRLLSDSI